MNKGAGVQAQNGFFRGYAGQQSSYVGAEHMLEGRTHVGDLSSDVASAVAT
eukprot:CAMPEP_0196655378 /NCGR_PEP_ID=MMETSP1086-20130531/5128_1 /TAXON_ID=77921 /ORGANISM="Cyanoptyche  gloeocystis , Strain SAG4.97" /LENGTH=50 /DNA_ID=CAMNT_0041987651 /DNA_START=297 /DNA_END=449 /DNA_ORIENTATION=+